VAALGENMSAEPLPDIRGIDLTVNDPLVDGWVVVVVGTHYHGALIAKDLGDTGSIEDRDRRFAYVVTRSSDTVLAAARSLLQKLAPNYS
jgi:DICT domain-containing protein